MALYRPTYIHTYILTYSLSLSISIVVVSFNIPPDLTRQHFLASASRQQDQTPGVSDTAVRRCTHLITQGYISMPGGPDLTAAVVVVVVALGQERDDRTRVCF